MKIKIILFLIYSSLNLHLFAQPCNLMLSTAVNNAMGGGQNGTINLSVNGGTPPYSFMWSNGSITQNLNLLPPGCYTVVVMDAAGCQSMTTACVTNLTGPILYSNSNPVSTFSIVNGGFTPQWVCQNQTLQTDGGIMKIYLESGATMITGEGIGTVYAKTGSTITMNGGIHVIYHEPGVTLNMNGGIPTLYPCQSLVFNYSQAPANGCAPVLTCNLSVSLGVGNAIGGGNNGSISTTVANGTFPFTYAWSNAQTTPNLTSLNPGAYSVIVTDANGCIDTAAANVFSVAGPTVLSNSNVVSSYQVVNGGFTPQWVCQNDTLYTDGGIMNIYLEAGATMITGGGIDSIFAKSGSTIIMNGGIHRIYHEPGVNLVMNGGIPYLNLCPNLVFNYSQAPANGCVPVPVCNLTATASVNNVLCNGQASGSASVNPIGGTAPFSYVWSQMVGNTQTVTNLASGSYSVTVTDANGCTANQSVTITEPSSIAMSTAITNIQCFGQNEGVTMVIASGGNAPYNLTYSGPISGNPPGNDILVSGGTYNISNLAPGSYSVNLTDANGCVVTQNFTITQPSQLTVTTSTTDELLGSDGTFSAMVSGGLAPYNISWSGPINANPMGNEILTSGGSYTANNLLAGNYTLTILDDNGCTQTAMVTVGSQVGLPSLTEPNTLCLYPNPTNGILNVQNNANSSISARVFAMDGRVITNLHLGAHEIKIIDLQGFSKGPYFIQFEGENGNDCQSFVKQ